mmetsp:Transcript_53106/g.149092  ORF Transcript_53106/g.149092 Transcript_53106/m.149092 type:complete len:195 (+) Transcript_53106:53-637(+)
MANEAAASSPWRFVAHHCDFVEEGVAAVEAGCDPVQTTRGQAIGSAFSLPFPSEWTGEKGQIVGGRAFASLGSAQHGDRTCVPCLFLRYARPCPNRALCEFCHEDHKGRKARRLNKQQRARCLRVIEKQMQTDGEKEAEVVTGKASHEHRRASIDRGTVARLGGRPERVEFGMGRHSTARQATDWPCLALVYSF